MLNCAVLERLIPTGCAVVDLGSGAGLPGIPLALARPDLTMELLDPLLRRTRWLEETVAVLGADGVLVRRARAQERTGPAVPVAVARAVASLEKLTGWAFPWLQDGGMLLALKGRRAAEELAASRDTLKRLGVTDAEIHRVGQGLVDPPATVVKLVRPAGWRDR